MKNQILTSTALILAATLPVFAADNQTKVDNKPTQAEATAPASTATTIVAKVNGLVCDFCVQSIQKTLMKEPGVVDAKVDLTAKTVTVALKEGAKLEEARLGKLLTDAGYDMVSYKVN